MSSKLFACVRFLVNKHIITYNSPAASEQQSIIVVFVLVNKHRYTYYSPAGSRLKVKSSERKTSPFNTFWYIRLGDGGVTSKVNSSSNKLGVLRILLE